jgi:hypothetical protein
MPLPFLHDAAVRVLMKMATDQGARIKRPGGARPVFLQDICKEAVKQSDAGESKAGDIIGKPFVRRWARLKDEKLVGP